MLNLGARVIVGVQRRSQLENIEILKYWDHKKQEREKNCVHFTIGGNCIKYLNTLNKVQIDQKSAIGLPIVPANSLTISLHFLFCQQWQWQVVVKIVESGRGRLLTTLGHSKNRYWQRLYPTNYIIKANMHCRKETKMHVEYGAIDQNCDVGFLRMYWFQQI